MTSFWSADDKIPISQTKISVPSTTGGQFGPGQKMEFHLPPSLGFFQPKESYLNLSVKINADATAAPTRLQLDAETGLQVLIKDIRVYSGGAGRQLLEEIQNVNVLTALKYDYETNDTLKAKRGLTEGATVFSESSRSDHGLDETQQQNLSENPYFKPVAKSASYSTAFDADSEYQVVKGLIQLNTGIFSNDRIFPISKTEGLVVELILEESRRVFRTLDQTSEARMLQMNPFFMSAGATTDTGAPALPNSAPSLPVNAAGSEFVDFFVRRDNCQGWSGDITAFPFCVGEGVEFVNASTGVANPSSGGGTSVLQPTIARIEYVGSTTNAIKVTLSGSYLPSVTLTQSNCLVSKSIARATTYTPTYTVTDAEFVVQQVEMPSGYTTKLDQLMKGGGAMNYDFVSATNYKISQLASERVANLRLPLSQSRAKAVLCVPTSAAPGDTKSMLEMTNSYITHYSQESSSTVRNWNQVASQRTGLVGCADQLTSYQLFYDGKLNPSRKVFCNKIATKQSIDQFPLLELEKALVMSGIKPYSMKRFRENFAVGRALSLQSGVYDTRGTDFSLQVEYQETTAPAVDKLWMCFVSHLRRISITGDAITLQV